MAKLSDDNVIWMNPLNDSKLTENDSNEDDSNDSHNNHHLRERKKWLQSHNSSLTPHYKKEESDNKPLQVL